MLRTQNIRPVAHYKRDRSMFLVLYEVLYLFILFWGNVVMYYFEYYNTDGYFTSDSRARSAAKRLLVEYVPFIVAGGVGLGVILGLKVCPPTAQGLSTFSKIATNAIYETLLMFLIGFGLVEFRDSCGQKALLKECLKSSASKPPQSLPRIWTPKRLLRSMSRML